MKVQIRQSSNSDQTNGFHYEFHEEKEQFGGNFLGKNLETNEMKCLKITIDHSNLTKAHLIKFKIYMQNDGSKGRCNISESSSEMKKKEFQCIGVGIQESFNISFETDENSPQGRNVVGNMPELIDREITNANHEIDGNEEQVSGNGRIKKENGNPIEIYTGSDDLNKIQHGINEEIKRREIEEKKMYQKFLNQETIQLKRAISSNQDY